MSIDVHPNNGTSMMLLLFIFNFAFAQSPSTPNNATPNNVTQIEFEGSDINGTLHNPAGEKVEFKKDAQFNSLLKPRRDFTHDIISSQDDI